MPKLNPAQLHEKIVALEDQHYPLRDHWNCARPYLDPRESENNYKHHLAHLEQIYSATKPVAVKPNKYPLNIKSPGTQLYGVNGLKYEEYDPEKINQYREKAWIENFQHNKSSKKSSSDSSKPSSSYLDGTNHRTTPEDSTRDGSKSAYPLGSSTKDFARSDLPPEAYELVEDLYGEPDAQYCSRKTKEDLSPVELNMLGLYRLNTYEEEIYQKFVDILKKMDPFDARNMLNDAYMDSQSISLDDYTGTQE